jgi:glycosyltransferase involved in cell wall biosynthesis
MTTTEDTQMTTVNGAVRLDAPQPLEAEMLCGRDMLCFSHDWTGDPLSKTHLMRLLARRNRILWVNSIGYRAPSASRADLRRAFRKLGAALKPIEQPEPNIFVLNPLVFPAYGISWVRSFNRWLLRLLIKRAMRVLGFRRPINWVFNPAAAIVAGQLGEERVIYYCVDEYTAFSGVSSQSLADMETELLRRADIVFVSAERLLRSKAARNPRTHLIRHGVDYAHFRKALDPATVIPQEIANLPRPVLGYFGLMAPDWIDMELLSRVAEHFRDGSLVLLGKATMDLAALRRFPNVHILGRKPYETLPAYCKGFDVALVPFPISEVTLNANPLKAREYLAAGLPVVSTAIPEVEAIGHCRCAASPADFVREINHALADPGCRAERSALMRCESWENRLAEAQQYLAQL